MSAVSRLLRDMFLEAPKTPSTDAMAADGGEPLSPKPVASWKV